jgi:predicted ATPase/DNA-binding CsgD family transcriptional regulator
MAAPLHQLHAQQFPAPATSLIGRDQEVADVVDLLRRDNTPLVTITGPGGVGKSRLAIKVADTLANAWRDGVWFVPLAPIHDPEQVLPAIAQALGLRETGSGHVADQLIGRLCDADILIVLDNFEQVTEAAFMLSQLVAACPGVRLLVTSRIVLRISAETVYQLDALAVPERASGVVAADLAGSDAVRLFVERAQASNRLFELDDDNAEVVADICWRLDGLPLAIELAAARSKMLSPRALQARLSRRLTLLTGGPVDQPARQQTLQAAVEWSVDLLQPYEQVVLRRLGVFAGNIPLGAAESVVGEGSEDAVLDAMSSLVDQSLLLAIPAWHDEPRFRMLQTIREYAEQMLSETGEWDPVGRRHADYYLVFAEESAPHLTGSDQVHWLNEIEAAHDDIRVAFDWYMGHDKPVHALRLAVAYWRFGYTRGYITEAREWLQKSLALNPDPTPLRAEGLNAEGLLASMQGDAALASSHHREALELSEALGDRRGIAVARNGLGDAAAFEGRRDEAREHFESALAIFRDLRLRRGIAGALTNLGNLYWDERELTTSVTLHEEALEHYRAIDDLRGIGWSNMNLGSLAVDLGDLPLGVRHLRDGMAIYRKLQDRSGEFVTLEGLAEVVEIRNHDELAVMLYAAAKVIRDEIGAPVPVSDRERYDGVLSGLRERLGDDFDRAWAEGELMTLDDAVTQAFDVGMGQGRSAAPPATAGSSRFVGLTRREIDVLELVARGKTNNEIADRLSISVRTASTHVSNILGKLDLPNRSAMAAYAHREGLV